MKRLICGLSGCFLILSSYIQITVPSGVCNKEPLICCTNYRRVKNNCEECWPGTFGVNCNRTCPNGFYGRFCLEKCNCSSCHKISGCRQNINSSVNGTDLPKSSQSEELAVTEDADWLIVAMFVSGTVGLCFVIGFVAHNKLRRSKIVGKQQLNPSARTTPFAEN
ncbi:protein draper-like [Saccostrea cucullata]|uniref:protein draper-like n=1 Tax=Saccostrea cuccullata TaxID=36930 RepID=UPI002ED0BE7E